MKKHINTLGRLWRKKALKEGLITEWSTPQPFAYDISRHWRRMLNSSTHKGDDGYDRKEREAAKIIISTIRYLKVKNPRLDIEGLVQSQFDEPDV